MLSDGGGEPGMLAFFYPLKRDADGSIERMMVLNDVVGPLTEDDQEESNVIKNICSFSCID